jgi:hypothetical protein
MKTAMFQDGTANFQKSQLKLSGERGLKNLALPWVFRTTHRAIACYV